MKYTRDQLQVVATEMNTSMSLAPPIDVEGLDDESLLDQIKVMAQGDGVPADSIRVDDKFSKEAWAMFVDLGVWDAAKKTAIFPVTKKKAVVVDEAAVEASSEELAKVLETPRAPKEAPVKKAAKAAKPVKAPKAKKEKAPKAKKEKVAKPVKAKPVKALKAVKKEKSGPGVISTILELIIKDGPITKADIHKKLVKMFPDRDADGMMKTIHAQLPRRIEKERGIKLVEIEGSGWKRKK